MGRRRNADFLAAIAVDRIHDRVVDHRIRAAVAGFAAAFDAERVGLARHRMGGEIDMGDFVCAGQGVIHVGPGQKLAVRIVNRIFEQHLADALGDAAMDLSFDDQRVHDNPEIVDHGITIDADIAGIGIDFDFGDMAAVRKADRRRVVVDLVGQRIRQIVRCTGNAAGFFRKAHDADITIGAGDRKYAVGELDILDRRFQHMAGKFLAVIDDDAGTFDNRATGRNHRARSARTARAFAHFVGIPLDEIDRLERNAELCRQYLRERRGVAHAEILVAGHQGHRAVFFEADIGKFGAGARCRFEIGRDADAAPFAGGFGCLFAGGITSVIGAVEAHVHDGFELA